MGEELREERKKGVNDSSLDHHLSAKKAKFFQFEWIVLVKHSYHSKKTLNTHFKTSHSDLLQVW